MRTSNTYLEWDMMRLIARRHQKKKKNKTMKEKQNMSSEDVRSLDRSNSKIDHAVSSLLVFVSLLFISLFKVVS